MTSYITVEPAHEMRPAFALWGLAQDPPLRTSSATGFDVPVDLYPAIPERLLNGAYVDGFHYNRPHPQPLSAELPDAVSGPLEVVPATTATKPATRTPRKRAARKVPKE